MSSADIRWQQRFANYRRALAHTYNQEVADAISARIIGHYHPLFVRFDQQMEQRMETS